MRSLGIGILIYLCLVSAVVPAGAQVAEDTSSMPADWDERVIDLREWVSEYNEWKAWREKWRNRSEPGWLGFRSRRQPPDPPAWLADDCASLLEADGILGEACQLLAEWKDPDNARVIQKRVATQLKGEEPVKTVWWEHIHFDALWPMPQWRAGIYGVVGVHATVAVAGRFQIFVAPGAILINLPNGPNNRDWQPAADWGISYRLADFKFPGSGREASLHFNFAKAWVLTGQPGIAKADVELAGFSFTFKKDRK
jgi:hypothetical protein